MAVGENVLETISCQDFLKDASCSNVSNVSFQQPDQLPPGEPLWPIREDQEPEVVHTAEEFLEVMLFETHVDRCVVLRNGINLLRQQGAIPERLHEAVASSSSVRSFLDKIVNKGKDDYRGRIWHYSMKGFEKEIKAENKSKLLGDKVAAMKRQEEEGLITKSAAIYVSELRYTTKQQHPIVKDEMVKTSTMCDVYDYTPLSRCMPLWERSEGGIFIGERGAGSGFHVDQCMWSNVGRNWCGHKLLALWPWEERFRVVEQVPKGKMFHLPLSQEDTALIHQAKICALVGPGDVWVFSGAQPHAAVVVGDALNVSGYESFVPAHPEAVGILVRSNIKDMHPKLFWMDDEDLDELYEDVVDNIQRALNKTPSLDQRLRSRLTECAAVMRDRGDAYCKELWRQEDVGQRRRRRESDSSSSGSSSPKRLGSTSSRSKNFSDVSVTSTAEDGKDGPKAKKARRGSDELQQATPSLSEMIYQ